MKLRAKIALIIITALAVLVSVIAACKVKNNGQSADRQPPITSDNPDSAPGTDSEPGTDSGSENGSAAAQKIVFSGAEDITVVQGTFFDFLSGVTAVSDAGEKLTERITVSGEINTAKTGVYTLVYSVTDSRGNTVEKERKISVEENAAIGQQRPVPVYTVASGANYNIAKGCDVSAKNSVSDVSNAVDGDFTTRWESTHGIDNIAYTVNLGASLFVNQIDIYWEEAYAKDFALLVSDDGVNWREVQNVEGQMPPRKTITGVNTYFNSFVLENVTAQFVRLQNYRRATGYGYSIYEFQIFGPTGTVIPFEEYPELLDAQKDSSPDWKIEDGQWLEYDLGGVKQVNRIRVAFQDNLTPADYTVLYAGADKIFTAVKTYNLPYSADTFRFNDTTDISVNARYFKIELNSRRFYASSYRITEVAFINAYTDGGELKQDKLTASVIASSNLAGHEALFTVDGNDATYWENENSNVYQTVDLGGVKNVGRVDLYWRGDDGGKGKYYDLQISSDGESWKTVFRQTHGATAVQSVFVYESARYIRVIDYQSPSRYRFMLEGMLVHSQYPATSGEGKVQYDTSLAFPELKVIRTENGSYVTGGTEFPSSRLIAYLDESLRGKPVPSNDWWQGLLIADKGYNMYMNPLTATFKSDGLWLTNPGEGYFDGYVPGNGSQTIDVDAHDVAIGYDGMGKDAEVRVTGYSDYGISAVMTDDNRVDKLTVFLSEGTLYAYCIFAEPEKALLRAENIVGLYDLSGNEILTYAGAEFTGDGIVICVRTHSGYEGGVRKYRDGNGAEHENPAVYEDRFYVVSVPEGTRFVNGESAVSVVMTNGNYMSVGAAGQKKISASEEDIFPQEEVTLLHEHGYAFVVDTSCTYSFDGQTNTVTTYFSLRTLPMRSGWSSVAYSAYLPHQIEKADYNEGFVYSSVRGDCRSYVGNRFVTEDTFYGIVPTFTEPDDDGYSASVLYNQLIMVYKNNGGDNAPADSNLISGDPYWQGKNLHPMAMAAIAADQIGATDLRDKFLDKIEYILTDWFTYDSVADAETGAYFYYDSEWGTLYYKNSEFGAGVNLADHYFTYGYYTLAAGVLSAYRPQFAVRWGDMISLLIRDYMNPDRDDEQFPYMRNFDPFAGHGWAGGYADNNGGNNQESAGEALNSWVGAYLYASAVGDEKVRLAAIYGYTTELNAIKHYWFNYFNDFTESYPYGVAGQVYGGSNFYGTFFNGQPLYMYGIHLIPGEEYLTSYALDSKERRQLENLIDNMRKEQAGWDVSEEEKEIHAWQHIFIPIVAIYDADEAIEWYDEVMRKQGNVGNDSEQFNVYWLIHGMKSSGVRTRDIWAEDGATATVYKNADGYTALCWNPTSEEKKFVFRNSEGVAGYANVPAQSLVSCDPTKNTDSFNAYADIDNFSLENISGSTDAAYKDGKLVLGENGGADYLVAFGSNEGYRKVQIASRSEGVRLYIDGTEISLTRTAEGYESAPVSLTFKHIVTVAGDNAVVEGITFEELTLLKSDVGMSATASSADGQNTADKAVDGDMTTRWESTHGSDDEWLEIELASLTEIYQLKIFWEAASAKEYKVYFSQTGAESDWIEVYGGSSSAGARTDIINPSQIMQAKYIRIECISRITDYGYSIYELELYNFNA